MRIGIGIGIGIAPWKSFDRFLVAAFAYVQE